MKPVLMTQLEDTALYEAFKAYSREMKMTIFRLPYLFQHLQKENTRVMAIYQEDKIIAFLMFNFKIADTSAFHFRYCYLRELWTHPDFRHDGLATSLLLAVELYCYEMGIRCLLFTGERQPEFYGYSGYRRVGWIQAANGMPVYAKMI